MKKLAFHSSTEGAALVVTHGPERITHEGLDALLQVLNSEEILAALETALTKQNTKDQTEPPL